jgi:hypothetical protein
MMSFHYEHSSYREKLLEHLFVGELLRHLLIERQTTAELLKPEVDDGGYDLVLDCNSCIRHIQLKTSHSEGKAAYQKVNVRLADKPSGCIIWIVFDAKTLALGPFRWFGNEPNKPLPDVRGFSTAKHTKGNAQGVKTERPNIRLIKKADFPRTVQSIAELAVLLFGPFRPLSL